jgi:putative DNA primase/helicase
MSPRNLAKALGGRKAGAGWMARCPAHQDREPSLSITEGKSGKMLVHCHAGCDQQSVISALRARDLWTDASSSSYARHPRRTAVIQEVDPEESWRSAAALALWHSSTPARGSLVEAYLASRRITVPIPDALRFHAGLKHPSGGVWPAMAALVTHGGSGSSIAIHRTFLARNGGGKAPVDPAKMMLGPCRGGVVRLAEAGDVLMIGEGIETCLAAMQATGNPAWAALSTSGLRSLDLPGDVRDLILLADGDEPGEAAARDAARRWKREGRRVRIARPPVGMDFNDLLKPRVLAFAEGAR